MAVFIATTSMQVNGQAVPKSLMELTGRGIEFRFPSFPDQPFWRKGFLLKGPEDDIEGDIEDDVEDQVEDEIENEVEDQVEDEIEDEVEDQVEDEIEDEVEDQVEDEIEDEVEDQVEEEIEDQVEDQVENEIEDEVEDQVEEEIEDQVEDQVEEEIEDQVEDQVEEEIEAEVEDQVEDEIEDEVEDQVEDEIEDEVEDQVEDEIEDEVEDQVEDEIEDEVEGQVEDEIEDEVEDQVEEEIEDEVEDQVEDEIEDEVEDQVEDEVEDEIKDKVEDEIVKEIEDKVESKIEDDIEDDAEDKAREKLQDDFEDDLEDKIKEQIEQEEDINEALEEEAEDRVSEASDKVDTEDADLPQLEKVGFDKMSRDVEETVRQVERQVELVKEIDGHKVFTSDWQVLSDQKSLDELVKDGFSVTNRQYLAGLDLYLAQLEAPDSYDIDFGQYDQVMALNTNDLAIDLNHLYSHAQSAPADQQLRSPAIVKDSSAAGHTHPIGIIDSAIMTDHEAFQSSELYSKDFTGSVGKTNVAHGTAVASILVGQSLRYQGLHPGAPLWSASVFFNDSSGQSLAATTSIIQGLDWLMQANVHIINMSLAGPENKLLEIAIKRACDKQILIVAAAGNAGPTAKPLFPAAYSCTLAVTALDSQHQIYRRANRGNHIVAAAYGVKIRHADGKNSYQYSSGTSYAAPLFSSWLAENLPADNTLWQSWLDEQLHHFEDYGPKGKDEIYGFGAIPNQFGKHLLEPN